VIPAETATYVSRCRSHVLSFFKNSSFKLILPFLPSTLALLQWGLNCFDRSGIESVPGCSGDGVSGKDYCYLPPAGELVLVGNNNDPATAFPLQECQADCDSDWDCEVSQSCVVLNKAFMIRRRTNLFLPPTDIAVIFLHSVGFDLLPTLRKRGCARMLRTWTQHRRLLCYTTRWSSCP
jgi:hypothetical protein